MPRECAYAEQLNAQSKRRACAEHATSMIRLYAEHVQSIGAQSALSGSKGWRVFSLVKIVRGTVQPGISKLFQKHKKFTIASCLLSKGFDQMTNMGIISVLKLSQILNNILFMGIFIDLVSPKTCKCDLNYSKLLRLSEVENICFISTMSYKVYYLPVDLCYRWVGRRKKVY